MRLIIIIISFLSLIGCTDKYHEAKGLSVGEAIEKYHINLGEHFVYDEPPCKPIGIYGKTPEGGEIILYFNNGNFRESCTWDIGEFYNNRVIEVEIK